MMDTFDCDICGIECQSVITFYDDICNECARNEGFVIPHDIEDEY